MSFEYRSDELKDFKSVINSVDLKSMNLKFINFEFDTFRALSKLGIFDTNLRSINFEYRIYEFTMN